MNNSKGFTLAEVAIAVVIVALLLAGIMIPLGSQIEIRSVSETQRTMDQIKDAVIAFAQVNGRLPCPANGALPAGAAGAGSEDLQGSVAAQTNQCTSTAGVVPWATLVVPETDAWGRRFSYNVVQTFADGNALGTWSTAGQSPACVPVPVPPSPVSFALCTQGNLSVLNRSDGNHTTTATLGSALAAVVISHGKNGYGAYIPSGALLPGLTANSDEAANANHTGALTFYSRTPTPAASGCSDTANGVPFCEFDDIVVMIPAAILGARMVSAGKLP
jgi:prepilin-type N-terminal cleavage/methylation domain-containing protein